MIKIAFVEPTDSAWQQWCRDCQLATDELVKQVAAGEKPHVTKLYKDPRMVYVYKSGEAPFFGKCAYCESDIQANHPGDIEHWRPAKRVTDENNARIEVSVGAATTFLHPGYYWLAYDWRNLLLACEDCNRPSTRKTPGQRIGKWNQFPVRDFRASQPGDEVLEEPLLINPVYEDPSEHVEIDESTGLVIARTDRGETCVRVLGLNAREGLIRARLEVLANTSNSLQLASMAAAEGDEKKLARFITEREKIRRGSVPYSAAARVALRRVKESLRAFVEAL